MNILNHYNDLEVLQNEIKSEYYNILLNFTDGIAEYNVPILDNEGVLFIRNIIGSIAQFKSVSTGVITSCVYTENTRTLTIKSTYVSGTLFSGNQNINIILFVQYTDLIL